MWSDRHPACTPRDSALGRSYGGDFHTPSLDFVVGIGPTKERRVYASSPCVLWCRRLHGAEESAKEIEKLHIEIARLERQKLEIVLYELTARTDFIT